MTGLFESVVLALIVRAERGARAGSLCPGVGRNGGPPDRRVVDAREKREPIGKV